MRENRTNITLISELRQEAAEFNRAAIIVGFERDTKFVWDNSPDPLNELNALVDSGGKPIGLCGINIAGGVGYQLRAFSEYAHQAWVQEYFNTLGENFLKLLQKQFGVAPCKIARPRSDLN